MRKMAEDPLYFERKLWQSGYQRIAGVDEAGRGALAGPLVAAAVILPPGFECEELKESKLVSAGKRKALHGLITNKALAWSVAYISPREIDSAGIQLANLKVLREAVLALKPRPDFVLSDGFDVFGIEQAHKVLIKGDRRSLSIAAASIIAKVTRDSWMELYDSVYPEYGFSSHKGYGTHSHGQALTSVGPTPIHRSSFRPVHQAMDGGEGPGALREEGDNVSRSPRGRSGMYFPTK